MKVGDTVRFSLKLKRQLCKAGIHGFSYARHGKYMFSKGIVVRGDCLGDNNVFAVRWPDDLIYEYHKINITLVKSS